MKALLLSLALVTSFSALGSEIKVLEFAATRGTVSTRFEVNMEDGTAGVSAKLAKRTGTARNRRTSYRTFESVVPELSLNGKNLEFNKDGESVVCGTMDVTRVFKIPTLLLSGKCDLQVRRVSGKVVVRLITK